jgi:hypothetical protein
MGAKPCPFCNLGSGPHARIAECLAALEAEIIRLRHQIVAAQPLSHTGAGRLLNFVTPPGARAQHHDMSRGS